MVAGRQAVKCRYPLRYSHQYPQTYPQASEQPDCIIGACKSSTTGPLQLRMQVHQRTSSCMIKYGIRCPSPGYGCRSTRGPTPLHACSWDRRRRHVPTPRRLVGERLQPPIREQARFWVAGDELLCPPKRCRPGPSTEGQMMRPEAQACLRIGGGACVLDERGTAARSWLRSSSIMQSLIRIPALRLRAQDADVGILASKSSDSPLHYRSIRWRGPPLPDQLVESFPSLPYLDHPPTGGGVGQWAKDCDLRGRRFHAQAPLLLSRTPEPRNRHSSLLYIRLFHVKLFRHPSIPSHPSLRVVPHPVSRETPERGAVQR